MIPAVRQVIIQNPLWTPQRSIIKPRVFIDARNAVWSGSNLLSLVNTGTEGGSFTVNGTPDKGTAINGIDPIRFNADTEYLSQTLAAWGANGQISIFAWLKGITNNGDQGLLNRNWGVAAQLSELVCYVATSASGGTGGIYFISGFNQPSTHVGGYCAVGGPLLPDTTNYHGLYYQCGAGGNNFINRNGTTLTNIDNFNGTTPNGASFAWQFGRGDTNAGSQGVNSEIIAIAIFDRVLPVKTFKQWQGYYAHLTKQTASLDASHPYKSRPPRV